MTDAQIRNHTAHMNELRRQFIILWNQHCASKTFSSDNERTKEMIRLWDQYRQSNANQL